MMMTIMEIATPIMIRICLEVEAVSHERSTNYVRVKRRTFISFHL